MNNKRRRESKVLRLCYWHIACQWRIFAVRIFVSYAVRSQQPSKRAIVELGGPMRNTGQWMSMWIQWKSVAGDRCACVWVAAAHMHSVIGKGANNAEFTSPKTENGRDRHITFIWMRVDHYTNSRTEQCECSRSHGCLTLESLIRRQMGRKRFFHYYVLVPLSRLSTDSMQDAVCVCAE